MEDCTKLSSRHSSPGWVVEGIGYSLPELENSTSEAIRSFVTYLQNEKPYPIPLQVIRDDSHQRMRFLEKLIEDKNESGTSYYEFLQRVKTLIK
ncbi:Protein transport protein Sec24B [Homalodisca vitripennis]|nr:Protein transport protein Sec24B [Homalodisca vitripennis]